MIDPLFHTIKLTFYSIIEMKFISLIVSASVLVMLSTAVMADPAEVSGVANVEEAAGKAAEERKSSDESTDAEERHRGGRRHRHRRHCHRCSEEERDCLSNSHECSFCDDGCEENGYVIRVPSNPNSPIIQ